jgi:hypothetical protein
MGKNINRKAFLHIGSHKTGTSAVQKCLCSNTKKLKKNNFLFPISILGKNFCHNNLGLSILNDKDKDFEHYLHYLEKEVSSNKFNVIISSELLEKLILIKKEKIQKLIELLNRHFKEINIIYCIRNEPDLCDSVFKQMVGSKEYKYKESIDDFLSNFYNETFSYNNIANKWLSLKGVNKCFVYWYSKDFNKNLDNFNKACEINLEFEDPGIINMSLDGKILEIAYFYNQKNHSNHDQSIIKLLKSLQYSIKDAWTKSKTILTNEKINFYKNFFTKEEWGKNCIFLNKKPEQQYSKELFVPADDRVITEHIKELYKETNLLDLFKIII